MSLVDHIEDLNHTAASCRMEWNAKGIIQITFVSKCEYELQAIYFTRKCLQHKLYVAMEKHKLYDKQLTSLSSFHCISTPPSSTINLPLCISVPIQPWVASVIPTSSLISNLRVS